jgi:hypothetical protein
MFALNPQDLSFETAEVGLAAPSAPQMWATRHPTLASQMWATDALRFSSQGVH